MAKVAVTGHRPEDLWGYAECEGWAWLRSTLRGVLAELGAAEALSGMALGVDQVFVEAALEARVPVAAFVPFEGQERRWPAASQAAYRRLLARCARRVVVCPAPSIQAFLRRNSVMVQSCDIVVAVWTGKRFGGTYDAVQKALRVGRPIVWVDPLARQVWWVGSR